MTMFSKNLRCLREAKGMDHKSFGDLMGVSSKQISFFEDGFSEPDLSMLVEVCEKLQVSIDRMLTQDIEEIHLKKDSGEIKLLVLDIDGVLTDGGMYYTENGDHLKKFNVKDGRAIRKLSESGVEVAFLSGGSQHRLIKNRAEALKVTRVASGISDKLAVLLEWQKELSLKPEQIAVVGDDLNDLKIIDLCGLSACPADAVAKVRNKVDVVLSRKGGEGCIREFVETYLLEIQ